MDQCLDQKMEEVIMDICLLTKINNNNFHHQINRFVFEIDIHI